MSNPEILPIERQLESLIADNFDELAEFLADTYEAEGTFVDAEFETCFPKMLLIVDAIIQSALNNGRFEVIDMAHIAVYEAIYFGYSATRAVVPGGDPGIYIDDYYNHSSVDLLQKMSADAYSYLYSRPAIAGLISAFISSIDISSKHYELAEIVAAVTFMHIETGERHQYIDQEVHGFIRDIDKWEKEEC